MQFVEEHIGKVITAVIALIATGFTWLVRTVFTNEKKVTLLQQELNHQFISNNKRQDELKESLIKIEQQSTLALENQTRVIKELVEVLKK